MNDSHYFVTGSWDNDQNAIKLWDFQENEEDAEIYPFLVTELPHKGDITELKVSAPTSSNLNHYIFSSF